MAEDVADRLAARRSPLQSPAVRPSLRPHRQANPIGDQRLQDAVHRPQSVELIEDLAHQKLLINQSGPEAERMLLAGERMVSPTASSLNVIDGIAKGQPVALFNLEEGAVVGEIMFGIMKGARNMAAAKLLVEFMASVEGENALPAAHQTWPTHMKAVPGKDVPDIKGVKLISIKDTSQKTVDEFNKRFADIFKNK